MRLVIQRVSSAKVIVNEDCVGMIESGLLILLGICNEDTVDDLQWAIKKTLSLRIFNDENQQMNRSILDEKGSILIVSQFTLFASTIKGNRPSFIAAAKPEFALAMYQSFVETMRIESSLHVETGRFGAHMKVISSNDGPVTIIINTKNKE